MFNNLKRLLSLVVNKPIYIGRSTTNDICQHIKNFDNTRSVNGRRIDKVTCKFRLQPEYSIYELLGINKDISTGDITYKLISTLDDTIIEIPKDRFQLIFKKITMESNNEN